MLVTVLQLLLPLCQCERDALVHLLLGWLPAAQQLGVQDVAALLPCK
jgi:hypothetical protein